MCWIKDFQNNRKQRVIVNGSFSEWRDITSGIPQGSVLGPILFLIFIIDLPNVIKWLIKLFADDAELYQIIKSNQDKEDLQGDVRNSEEWAVIWKMFLNTKKCKHMHLGLDIASSYYMSSATGNLEREKVKEEKDLDVVIDNKRNFRQHISSKMSTANRNLGIIFRTFTYLSQVSLYKSMVRPHLEYASVIWSPLYKKRQNNTGERLT